MITPIQILQYGVDILILAIVAVAEHFGVVPNGTFYFILLFILGHIYGSVPTVTTLGNLAASIDTNTRATVANTLASTTNSQPTQNVSAIKLPTYGPPNQ